MSRPALLVAAALLLPWATRAQTPVPAPVPAPAASPATPAPATAPSQSQLDRIEHKLDEVLRRLDQRPPQPLGTVQGAAAAPAPGAAPTVSSAAPAAAAQAYKPGVLAVVRAAPKDADALADIPPDSVGGFVYDGGPMPLTEIATRGVRYTGPVGIDLQGWLRAKEAGRYQLATDLTARFRPGAGVPPTCFLQAWLEGRSLDQRSVVVTHPGSLEATASLVLGAELQPGLYRLRLWTVCTAPRGVTITSEFLLKAPSELNLRPVTVSDLLHREG